MTFDRLPGPQTSRSGNDRIHLEGIRKEAIEVGRNRLLITGAVLTLVYLVIAGRLVDVTVLEGPSESRAVTAADRTPDATLPDRTPMTGRANIVDRNGVVLATSLPTVSLYTDPREIIDAAETADKLASVLPELGRDKLLAKFEAGNSFAWLKRNLTPKQQYDVNRLGLVGIHFRRSFRRVYPHGVEAGQVLGLTDIDDHGIAGIERSFEDRLTDDPTPLALSLDIRIQGILHEEVGQVVEDFNAKGAAGIVIDVNNGEILGLSSVPLFDPNSPDESDKDATFNRATKGVYEMGSTFKLFTAAIALDSGTATMNSSYDATKPLKIAKFTIHDDHAKNRWLSVPEIVVYSSNIGAARMALDFGGKVQQSYLAKLGLLKASSIELPEVGTPLKPATWRDINTMTIGYGHGIAVTPVHMAAAVSAVVNGGVFRPATVIKRDPDQAVVGLRVFKPETSEKVRSIMRQVVTSGTGTYADLAEYKVGGKTGTAEKLSPHGGYLKHALVSSFIAAFPIEAPRYVVLIMVDEPRGTKKTYGFATGGWVAAPAVGRVIRRIGALNGMLPESQTKPAAPVPATNAVPQRAAPPGAQTLATR
jgi:cell division protein FtsI (penicillin-binding protein 3)